MLTGSADAVQIAATEAQLLTALTQPPRQTLERWQVAIHLKLDDAQGQRANLDVRQSQHRRKMREAGATDPCLQSIRGDGYRLCAAVRVV